MTSRFRLLLFATRAMNGRAAISHRKETTYMKAFTIDSDNNIMVHASRKAARETGLGAFGSEEEFAILIGADNKRLVEIWNSLPGVKPVTKFANRNVATERIWKALQNLGEQSATTPDAELQQEEILEAIPAEFAAAEAVAISAEVAPKVEPEVAPEPERIQSEARHLEDAALQTEIEPFALTPEAASEAADPVADTGAQAAQQAPVEGAAAETATPAKKERKAKKTLKAPKPESAAGPREGSKTAQVVAMLKTPTGATLEEIMAKMGWQKHTVRGFVAGAMKKAGYAVESFKSEAGARSYRINA
jgi:hypothetical protein